MPLKAIITTPEDLAAQPEAVRGLYQQIDGRWVLPVEGVVPAADLEATRQKLAEFRDNNTRVLKALEMPDGETRTVSEYIRDLRATTRDLDIDEYKALKAEATKLKSKGFKDADGLGTFLQQSIEKATKPLSDKLALIEEDRAKLKRDLESAKLRDAIAAIGTAKGVKPKALPYVLDKAKDLFRIVDDKVSAVDGVCSLLRPDAPLTTDEWLDTLSKTDDFLFEPNTGGGAKPGAAGGKVSPYLGPFRTSAGTEIKTDGIAILS